MIDSRLSSSSSLLRLNVVHPYGGQQSPAFGSYCHWNHCGTLQPYAHLLNNGTDSHKVGVHPHKCATSNCQPATMGLAHDSSSPCFFWNSPEVTLACMTFWPYWEVTPQCFVISNPFFQTVAKSLNHSVSKLLYALYVGPVWVSTPSSAWRTHPNSSYKIRCED